MLVPVDDLDLRCDSVIFVCLHSCSVDKDKMSNPPYRRGPNTTVRGILRLIPSFGSAAFIMGRWIVLHCLLVNVVIGMHHRIAG